MKTTIPILAVFIMMCLGGCATQNRPTYVWNNYSSSLYALKKDPGAQNLNKHKQVLLSIMEDSKKEGRRVPPGVCCEYGYLLLTEGKGEEATKYFELEEQTYPESGTLVKNLKALAIKTAKKDTDDAKETQNDLGGK